MSNSITTVPFDSKVDQKRQAAFVILYSLDGQPWSNYQTASPQLKSLTVPVCCMLNRADGAVGFIGGMVDGDESLEQAVIREVDEEIGYAISNKLEQIVAHDIGAITTHAFAMQVSYSKLRDIQSKATQSEHFGSEITGIFMPHLIDYDAQGQKRGGLVNLLQSRFAPSVQQELVHFLLQKNIIAQTQLQTLCTRAGYQLSDLLS